MEAAQKVRDHRDMRGLINLKDIEYIILKNDISLV